PRADRPRGKEDPELQPFGTGRPSAACPLLAAGGREGSGSAAAHRGFPGCRARGPTLRGSHPEGGVGAVTGAEAALAELWSRLYPDERIHRDALLGTLRELREQLPADPGPRFDPGGLVYCAYGDAFSTGAGPTASTAPLDGLAAQVD